MTITKEIFLGTLEIDLDRGVIWLNSYEKCLLRICQLDFKQKVEKFNMIDIAGGEAFMLKGTDNSNNEEVLDKLKEVVHLLISKIDGAKDKEKFLNEVSESIKYLYTRC